MKRPNGMTLLKKIFHWPAAAKRQQIFRLVNLWLFQFETEESKNPVWISRSFRYRSLVRDDRQEKQA